MYFLLAQRQQLALALLFGFMVVFIIAVWYFSYRLGTYHTNPDEPVEPGHEFNDGLTEGNRPYPIFLVLVWITVILWGIGYVIAVSRGWLNVP